MVLLKLRMLEVVVTTGAIRHAKLQSNHHHQHPTFYRPDALPVTHPSVSKHWREKYHIPWTCLPQAHLGVFQLCLWPLTALVTLGEGLPCLSSALWCQYPKVSFTSSRMKGWVGLSGWLRNETVYLPEGSHPSRLVLGWVTAFRQVNCLIT